MKTFMTETGSRVLFVTDSFWRTYYPLLEELPIRIVLVNPMRTMGFVKQTAYRLINRKRLSGLVKSGRMMDVAAYFERSGETPTVADAKCVAVYLHSGGTSGKPKTIQLSSSAINALAMQVDYIMAEADFNGRHMLAVLPMFHGFGLCMGIHGMLIFGGVDTLMPKFNATQAIQLIKKNQITLYHRRSDLVQCASESSEVRRNASSQFKTSVRRRRFRRSGAQRTIQRRNERIWFERSIARRVRIDRSRHRMRGQYPQRFERRHRWKTVARHRYSSRRFGIADCLFGGSAGRDRRPRRYDDAWLSWRIRSNQHRVLDRRERVEMGIDGDYGFFDTDGYLHFKQRLKRIVKVSGMPVMPSEIETIVTAFPNVKEAAAVGVPDEQFGNVICVYLVARDPSIPIDEDRSQTNDQGAVVGVCRAKTRDLARRAPENGHWQSRYLGAPKSS
ncbi:MAG: AMP-binding protein [Bacillus subtilis]|nr:AMP-binding protein [Bacillus subtilis]